MVQKMPVDKPIAKGRGWHRSTLARCALTGPLAAPTIKSPKPIPAGNEIEDFEAPLDRVRIAWALLAFDNPDELNS